MNKLNQVYGLAYLEIRKAHRDDRGAVSILLVLLTFVLLALIAMVWNTGEFSNSKLRVQASADVAAYSAAQHNARALNMITISNHVILRTASAEVLAAAVLPTINIIRRRLRVALFAAKAMQLSIYPPTVTAGYIIEGYIRYEQFLLGKFIVQTAPALLQLFALETSLRKLYKYQQAVVAQTPRWVEQQRSKLEMSTGHKIYLTQAGAGSPGKVIPPVEPGNVSTISLLISDQVKADRDGYRSLLRKIRIGKGWRNWVRYTGRFSKINSLKTRHHVLTTQFGPIERKPRDSQRDKEFTVLSVASTRWSNRPSPMIPSFHGKPVRDVVAFASAETFNGNDTLITSSKYKGRPWRVWTKHGWYWRPRMTYSQSLNYIIKDGKDTKLEKMFRNAGIRFPPKHEINKANKH